MKKITCIFLVVLVVFLTSCENNETDSERSNDKTEEIVENNEPNEVDTYQEDQFILTIEQAITDYQFMWGFFEEKLPSFSLLERVRGIDIDEVKEEGLEFLALYENDLISIRDFHHFLTQHLMVFIPTFHLSVVDGGLSEFMLHPDNLSLFFDDVIFDLEWTQTVYHHLFPWIEIETSEMEDQPTSPRPWLRIINDYTAVINIPSFSMFDHESEELHQLYLSFYEEATALGIENLIFDVSQNGGGNTRHWGEHIVAPNIEEEVFFERLVLTRDSQTIIDYIGFWIDLWYGKTIELRPISERQFEIKQPEDLYELGLYVFIEDSIQPNHNRAPAFEGNFFVLIDGLSFSTSDTFASFVYQTGFATLIGRPTSGAGIGIQPMTFSLPESGLLVRFDACYGVNADGSANQEIGTSPHYFSEGDENPLRTVLRIIEERRLLEQE